MTIDIGDEQTVRERAPEAGAGDPAAPGATVALCIINFNGERMIEEVLGAAVAQAEKLSDLVLVDSGSTDRSLEIAGRRFPAVRPVRLDANRGPAAARNAGFAAARGDRILFVDNDAIVAPGCLDALMGALDEHPRAAIAQPRVLDRERRGLIHHDGAESHLIGLSAILNSFAPVEDAAAETRPISSLVSTCFLLDRTRWGAEAPFDDSFCFNYEDYDLGLRARILGHEVLSVPAALVYHGSGTAGLSMRPGGAYASARVFHLIRNRWQILLKDYQARTLLALLPVLIVYEVAQFAGALKKRWWREWFSAFFWLVGNARGILRKRRTVQRARRTPDRAILRSGPLPFRDELTGGRLERAAKRILDRVVVTYGRIIGWQD